MANEYEPVGIGDQVIIKHDSKDGSRDWVGEPSGEIVAAADDHVWDAVVGEMSAEFPWVVALDSPQYLQDGTGPFTETTVEAWRLVHAPTSDDTSAVEDASAEQDAGAAH
ncbi:MAG: hypothetical protein ABIP33_04345 [Pseudolysinimonas sp.]